MVNPHGYPPLLAWAQRYVAALHTPPREDHMTVITCSSTTALMVGVPCTNMSDICGICTQYTHTSHPPQGVLALLVEPGGCLLTEAFTYPNVLESNCLPRSVRPIAVDMDQHGLCPVHLDKVPSCVLYLER